MRIITRLIIALLPLICFSSCVRSIYMDAGDRAVVVECILTDSLTQKLNLSYTKGVSQIEATPLTDAVATLIDLTDSVTIGDFTKSSDAPDLWVLDYAAVPDHDYRLEIRVPGKELIYAESRMPSFPTVDYHWNFAATLISDNSDTLYFRAVHWKFHTFRDPVWIYGIKQDKNGRRIPMDEICTDLPMADPFNLTGATYSTPSKTLPEYPDETCYLYPSLEGERMYRRYLHIPEGCDPRDFDFKISFLDHEEYPWSHSLRFNVVSASYDRYLKELLCHVDPKEIKDLSSIYLRDNFYTNVTGGIGVFGGMISRIGMWPLDYSPLRSEILYGGAKGTL